VPNASKSRACFIVLVNGPHPAGNIVPYSASHAVHVPERHLDRFGRFHTAHQCDQQTDRQTQRPRHSVFNKCCCCDVGCGRSLFKVYDVRHVGLYINLYSPQKTAAHKNTVLSESINTNKAKTATKSIAVVDTWNYIIIIHSFFTILNYFLGLYMSAMWIIRGVDHVRNTPIVAYKYRPTGFSFSAPGGRSNEVRPTAARPRFLRGGSKMLCVGTRN